MNPEYPHSDSADVIQFYCEEIDSSPCIEISDSDDDTHIPDPKIVKSQRQTNIEKVFASPSCSSSKPEPAVNFEFEVPGVKLKVCFPVTPYECQRNVITEVILAFNDKENCLVESPTGTGKTFALLCASLAWQLNEKEIIDKSVVEDHSQLEFGKLKFSPNKTNKTIPTPLFSRQNFGGNCIYDDHNIEDMGKKYVNYIQEPPGPSTATDNYLPYDNLVRYNKKPRIDTNYEDLTRSHPTTPEKKEVRIQTTPEKNRDALLDNMKKIINYVNMPVIYYGTRTHKQLEQVVQEYSKTFYSQKAKMTILSSRENSCIREYDSRQWSSKKEMCKSYTKPASSNNKTTYCDYYNNRIELNRSKLLSTFDLNDLKKKGLELRACPYYAARNMKDDSNIVFCPYNFIIDPLIRKSMGINIENDIIIIDEGHNIEDICRQTATFSFTSDQVNAAIEELQKAMFFRFANQNDETHFIELLKKVLNNWKKMLTNCNKLLKSQPVKNKVVTYDWNDMNKFKQTLEEYEIGESHYPDFNKNVKMLINKMRTNPDTMKQITTNTVTLLESLDLILGYILGKYSESYKPQLEVKYKDVTNTSVTDFEKESNKEVCKLHLRCVDPGVLFAQLGAARSVVLASGTLAPVGLARGERKSRYESLEAELGIEFKYRVEDGGTVFDKNVWVGVLGLTTDNKQLRCNFDGLKSDQTHEELGKVLVNVCSVVPHGVLCFLPSYAVLNTLYAKWFHLGIINKIQSQKHGFKKTVFRESNSNEHHEDFMKGYTAAAKTSGALLLAVFRGKAAEGMDFRDELARAVVLVGIPYLNKHDEAIRTKMEYNDAKKKTHPDTFLNGKEWLKANTFRAVNQAMGRCVRHRRDWGAVLLVDWRYAEDKFSSSNYMSTWAHQYIKNKKMTIFDSNSLINHPDGIKAFIEKTTRGRR